MLPRSILCHAAKLAPVVLTCALAADVAWCARAELMGAKITIVEPGEPPGLFVEAHYEFDLPTPLINAMHRGIALYFAYSFELTKSRWYWLDKEVASSTFTIRLAFNPLTRRYAVSYSGYSISTVLKRRFPILKIFAVGEWQELAMPNQEQPPSCGLALMSGNCLNQCKLLTKTLMTGMS